MSTRYFWSTDGLSVGVDKMDREHQELIAYMNAIYIADQKRSSTFEIESLFDSLIKFAEMHFADEEEYMSRTRFAGLATHKIIHRQLLAQLRQYAAEFRETHYLKTTLFDFFKMWVASHMGQIDMKYAPHVRHQKSS